MSYEDDVKKLIKNNRRRLQILKEQKALQGISVDPKILIEIEDIEAEIENLQKTLKQSTSYDDIKSGLPTSSPVITTRQPFEPELILIPAGEFLMGSDPNVDRNAEEDEQPQHTVYLPDYYIAKTPVTNTQYAIFVQATGYQTLAEQLGRGYDWIPGKEPLDFTGGDWQHPRGLNSDISTKAEHPVVQISWHDAMAYCKWLFEKTGKQYRLPTEPQWEKAARGTDGRIYPWGNQWDAKRCNTVESDLRDTTPVDAYPSGVSPYGLLDVGGNVWEWTLTLWGKYYAEPDFSYPYDPTDGRENLQVSSGERRVLRGYCFTEGKYGARCAGRHRARMSNMGSSAGFRVVVLPTVTHH